MTTSNTTADWAATEITNARALCDGEIVPGGAPQRSPEKVRNFLHRYGDRPRLSALRELRQTDTRLATILAGISNQDWLDTVAILRDFADQTGGQRLIPREKCPAVGKKLGAMLRETMEGVKS